MTTRDPLAEAEHLYEQYREAVEISTLAELAQALDQDDQDPWVAPPVGLVLLG